VDADVATMTLLERLDDGGEVFLTHTTVGGRPVLRVAIGAPATTHADVERVWALLCENHDWLAADFAEIAAQRERAEAERRAEVEREVAEKEAAAKEAAAKEAAAKQAAAQEAAAREDEAAALVETPAAEDETAAQAAAQAELPAG
jgi:aromatic-L-amino-acid decarboxylase